MEFDLNSCIENFINHLKVFRHASIHTVRNYLIDLGDFANFMDEKKYKLEKADRKMMREYIGKLSLSGLKKRSLQRKISTLRSFFKHLTKFCAFPSDPMELIEPMKQAEAVPKALSKEEIELFFKLPDVGTYLGLRDRVIFELLYSSGLRVAELQGLDKSDVDFSTRLIQVRGKGNKNRIVPITENCRNWLELYLNHMERDLKTSEHEPAIDNQAIFLNRFGKRITTRSIDRLFKEYLLKSGLPAKVTPHVIRHSIATHWLENGMNLKVIQEILGHESLATTQIYTKVSKKHKQEGYAKAHPLMKKKGKTIKPDSVAEQSFV